MKPITILKLGTASPDTIASHGDCEQWIIRTLGNTSLPVRVIDILGGEALPAIESCAAAVLTGSGAMVTERLPWSEATRGWLQQAVNVKLPIFAICYGHQLLADACGGEVDYHPDGLEIGNIPLHRHADCDSDPLFAHLPGEFSANATHFQSVLRLPDNAIPLLANGHDPHHAYRIGSCAWGVQFHPEFCTGVMRAYIERRRPYLEEKQRDADALIAQLAPTPDARALLIRFAEWVAAQYTGEIAMESA